MEYHEAAEIARKNPGAVLTRDGSGSFYYPAPQWNYGQRCGQQHRDRWPCRPVNLGVGHQSISFELQVALDFE
mgnify:CR=1 FL=1